MKFKTLLPLAAFAACVSSASASFSLDFSGLDLLGQELSEVPGQQLIISVDGFGDVGFGAGIGTENPALVSEVVNTFTDANGDPVQAILFDDERHITVSFFGGPVEDVVIEFVGVDPGEAPVFIASDDYLGGTISLPSGVAGIASITFTPKGDKAVPEPSTAILGCLGAIALLRRRR